MSTPDIPNLLAKFDEIGNTYFREEVEQALQMQKEITPHLLQVLKDVGDNPLIYCLEMRNGHVYAALLLSEFREPAAHELFIRAFSIPEEQLVELWGDLTTETLPTFLFRTCGDSLDPIKGLIVNREADQYVRCAAMEALSYLVAFDPSRREEVVGFCQGLFTGEEAAKESYFWSNLVATLCDIHPVESMDTIHKAYDDGLVQPGFIGLEKVEEANGRNMEAALEALKGWVESRMPADVHGYISWFAEFQQEDRLTPSAPQEKAKNKAKKAKKKGPKKAKR